MIDYRVDCFSEAPMLRKAYLNTTHAFKDPESDLQGRVPSLKFSLPFHQIEDFTASFGSNAVYQDFIEALPLNLRVLNCLGHYIPPIPLPVPITLSKLVEVSFSLEDNGATLHTLFEYLTAPSLSTLSIIGSHPVPSDSLTRNLSMMIQRSKCSLESLILDCADTRLSAFTNILCLSSNITKLDIPHLDTERLRFLILDVNSPNPILPKLRRLWIRNCGRSILPGSFELEILDAVTFMEMLNSRTTARDYDYGVNKGKFAVLEEVHLFGYDDVKLHSDLKLTEPPEDENQAIMDDLAAKFESTLDKKWSQFLHSDTGHATDFVNIKLHMELDRELREMENLDLEKYDTRVLVVGALQ
ncbi:hypothetical protein EST38_g9608 [Candolleomyces aberdarensis]|uniref:F-box domain-containing protein n=1 Tax=Candolleomyces aberdarensis TaxID=2316362 RepID=A0A4Q2DBN6_9AGAR|nr:hypothetical protein EST38_g9608 [Candolleomyces aberdarensis]